MSIPVKKKKQVRFASMEDEQEDTLFEKRTETNLHRCTRWMVTLAVCGSFLGLGMSISILGPTFQDLAHNVHKNISNISYIFVGRSGGYIIGSLIGGALFECMNPHLLLGVSMMMTSFGMFFIPFCKQAILLTGLMSIIGLSMGALDTGGNVLILNTWGDQAGPHMQALHFSFAAGAFLSPIIAKMLFNFEVNSTSVLYGRANTLHSLWSYIIIGFFLFLVSFSFLGLRCRDKSSWDKSSETTASKSLVAKHHVALVTLLFFFFFAYVGAEVAYGSFIFTFAKDYAHMPVAQAAGLNSLFWGAFAATRGAAIFLAACIYPGTMIVLCLVGSTLSSLLLCLFNQHKVALWVCSGVYGASMATTFPSGISWLEQYTTVTGHTAAAFVVGAALGEMVLPATVGFLMGRLPTEPLLMYLCLVTAACTSILFPVMCKLASAESGPSRTPRCRVLAEDREFRQALLDSAEEDDVEQWNNVDFEVIEMNDTMSVVATTSPAPPTSKQNPVEPNEGEGSPPPGKERLIPRVEGVLVPC